jgi:group I intron endonuclease
MGNNNFGLIYHIENILNGKIYVGQTTKSFEDKKKHYLKVSKKGGNTRRPIVRAFRKYGFDNFKFSILKICSDKKDLCDSEKFYISKLNSTHPNGYNVTPGGEFGDTISNNPNREDIIKRIHINSKGRKQSEETIRKRILSRKGYRHSEETKIKLSKAHIGKGHPQSIETRKKISSSLKGHQVSNETRQKLKQSSSRLRHKESTKKRISEVLTINTPNEEIKSLYLEKRLSIIDISKKLNFSQVTIYRRLNSMGIKMNRGKMRNGKRN